MNIVVVGAGLAGLAAAWRLQERGHVTSVVEARDRLGGRFGSEWVEGFCMDRSVATLHGGDRRLMGWMGGVGLEDDVSPPRPLQLAQVRHGVTSTIDPQTLAGAMAIPGVRKRDAWKLLRWSRLMARYAPLLDPTAPERAADLDFRSAADFGRVYYGASLLARWIAPEITKVHSGDARSQSRVNVLLGWTATRTGIARPVLHGLPRRGLQGLIDAAAEKLSIHRAVEVTRIDEVPSGGFNVACRGLGRGLGRAQGEIVADAVVLSTSAPEAGRIAHALITPAERDYLEAVRYGPAVTLAVALDRPPCGMPQWVSVPRDEGCPADAILLEPGIPGGRAPMGSGLATIQASERFALANRSAPNEVLEKALLAGLERLYPALAGAVKFTRLCRRDDAIPKFDVGAYRDLARFRRVQADRRGLSRRLYFAGDYLIGPRAESSVIAGLRAAQDIDDDDAENAEVLAL